MDLFQTSPFYHNGKLQKVKLPRKSQMAYRSNDCLHLSSKIPAPNTNIHKELNIFCFYFLCQISLSSVTKRNKTPYVKQLCCWNLRRLYSGLGWQPLNCFYSFCQFWYFLFWLPWKLNAISMHHGPPSSHLSSYAMV